MHSKILTWSGYLLAAVLLFIVHEQWLEIEHLKEQQATPPATLNKTTLQSSSNGNPSAVTPAALSGFLADPRNAALLHSFSEIDAHAVPGQPNQRLIEAADDLLLDNDFERRTRNFSILLSKLRPEDCVAMHDHFTEIHKSGRGLGPEYAAFSTLWGKLDPLGALRCYYETPNQDFAPIDVHNVIKGWANDNPASALAWVEANKSMVSNGLDPFEAVYRGWARKDVAAATASMLEKCTDPNQRVVAARTIFFEQLYSKGLDASLSWLKTLPSDGSDAGAMSLSILGSINQSHYDGRSTPEQMANTWLTLGNAPWLGLGQFEQLINSCRSGREPIMEQLNSPAALPVLQEQFQRWSTTDPDAVGNWLNTNANSPLYDPAASSLARSLAHTDPTAAQVWANTIRDPALRSQALSNLVR